MNQQRLTLRIGLVLIAMFCVMLPDLASACPSCKEGLGNEHHDGLQAGFYWSIVFMMSMPFLILGGLSTLFYLSIRKAKRLAALEQTAAPAHSLPTV